MMEGGQYTIELWTGDGKYISWNYLDDGLYFDFAEYAENHTNLKFSIFYIIYNEHGDYRFFMYDTDETEFTLE